MAKYNAPKINTPVLRGRGLGRKSNPSQYKCIGNYFNDGEV